MNRDEHLNWCKQRALEYANAGQLKEAVSSMLSDMNKHPDTELRQPFAGFIALAGMQDASSGNFSKVVAWINGFN